MCIRDSVYLLGKAIYDELKPKKTVWTERFFQIITSLRAGFKLDMVTGEPCFDIGLGDIQAPQTTLDEIFAYLETADKPCIVAIDEFQQIGGYEEKNVEALLRTKIQQCKQTMFIFSGSKRHLMSNMFNSSSKPFYQSAISIGLEPIPIHIYVEFANRLFEQRGKLIDKSVIEEVYRMFDGYTWFVQMIMNELFALTEEGERCSMDKIEIARKNVILTQDVYKRQYVSHEESNRSIGIFESGFSGLHASRHLSEIVSHSYCIRVMPLFVNAFACPKPWNKIFKSNPL